MGSEHDERGGAAANRAHVNSRARHLCGALFCLQLLQASQAAEGRWDPTFGPSQPDGPIHAATIYRDEPYFGGDFLVAGRRDTPYVAKFVGGRWVKPLGYPSGPVFDFLVRDDVLYIAGALATPGFFKSYVAYHDGQNWIRLGNLFSVQIQGLEVLGGELYAFGQGIFRWNGTGWVQEPGISTGTVLWVADLNGALYASHASLGLFRREAGSWVTLPNYLFVFECLEPSARRGLSNSCVKRDSRLVLTGDFWGFVEGEATLRHSPQVVRFDGVDFYEEVQPWISNCRAIGTRASIIYHAADLGAQILAAGRFYPDPQSEFPWWSLALHDGAQWSLLPELRIAGETSRVLHSAGETWVADRHCTQSDQDMTTEFGRIARYDSEQRAFEFQSEANTLGLRSWTKGTGRADCLAVHGDAVAVGGDFSLPVGFESREDAQPICLVRGNRLASIASPLAVQPSALLSTARGLYAADDDVVVRIGEGDDREVLVSDVLGFSYVLAEHDDALILGGAFGALDGVEVTNLARLRDGTIQPLGDPNGPVRALAYFQGDLVAGGDFTEIGGVQARAIARWDGNQWSGMGEPFTRSQFGTAPSVRAFCVWRGGLYAGGDFIGTETTNFGHIARWNGSAWVPLTAIDIQAPVNALIEHGDWLFAGGEFLYAGNIFMGRITAFDGEDWIDVGALANAPVRGLASLDGDLYVGGEFSLLGGWNSYGLARWRLAPRPEPEAPPRFFWFEGAQPNPFNPRTSLVFRIPSPGRVEIEIFDSRGRMVRRLDKPWSVPGELRVDWDGADDAGRAVASGSYRVRASYGGQTQTRMATLVR